MRKILTRIADVLKRMGEILRIRWLQPRKRWRLTSAELEGSCNSLHILSIKSIRI